jgi:hypothetical protein
MEGGGMYAQLVDINLITQLSLFIQNSIVQNNSAETGGGVYLRST